MEPEEPRQRGARNMFSAAQKDHNRFADERHLRRDSVPTFVAKNESVFQGSRYPLKPNPKTRNSSSMPLNQVNSLGFR